MGAAQVIGKTTDSRPPRVPYSVWLLASTAFFAPYIGGNLNLEASTLAPGFLNFLSSLFDGADTPGAAALLIVAGALVSIIGLALQRRVLQLPNTRLATAMFLFVGVLTASILISSFKSVSVEAWAHWVAYALVFFAAATAVGRVRG